MMGFSLRNACWREPYITDNLKIELNIMDKNEISLREHGNDGKSVFLYYDTTAGVYLAFG